MLKSHTTNFLQSMPTMRIRARTPRCLPAKIFLELSEKSIQHTDSQQQLSICMHVLPWKVHVQSLQNDLLRLINIDIYIAVQQSVKTKLKNEILARITTKHYVPFYSTKHYVPFYSAVKLKILSLVFCSKG